MEKVENEHPARKLAGKSKWLETASDRMKAKGTKGSLTRIAAKHGESAMEFADSHRNDQDISPAVRKKIIFAENATKGK